MTGTSEAMSEEGDSNPKNQVEEEIESKENVDIHVRTEQEMTRNSEMNQVDAKSLRETTNGVERDDKDESQSDFSSSDYELVQGRYYYTDKTSGRRYLYDADAEEWVATDEDEERQTTTDGEGRTYYYAENMRLCRDPEGNVFFLNEKNEWRPWTERAGGERDSKWYFYEGDDVFYRDRTSNKVYKLDRERNEWEAHEEKPKKRRGRPRGDEVEEFDTDEDEDEEEFGGGLAPPGANSDPNVSYDGTTYTKLDPSDNMMYEWDANRRAWFPKVDEDFMATYQLSYGFNPDGTKNENPLKFDDDEEEEEAARRAEEEEEKKRKEKAREAKKKPSWFEMDEAHNTKVYVSNLPDSMTEEEFLELMQKCGMILRDIENNKPKIKMYRDEEGNFKGDALCTYIKIESVNLALQILDEYQVGNKKIHVEQAKFQLKGAYNPKLRPKKRRKKELEKIQKRQEKLFDWRPEPLRGQRLKHENTVVIRDVFDPMEFITAMEKILVHKDAMRNQCSNFGRIKRLDLYDLHPDGVVVVKFEEVEAADMCVATLNRRLYNSRTLSVSTWDGKEKFKIEETAEEREERLKKWNKFLEGEEDSVKKCGE